MPAMPSLELLRALSDEHVLRSLLAQGRQTKTELAISTGISKPTVAESIRRLESAGIVIDTGDRTSGPGRIGVYYGLRSDVGAALVVAIAPSGVVAETVDVRGEVVAHARAEVANPARPHDIVKSLKKACTAALADTGTVARLAVVSAADPVDRTTGRLVEQPDAPFLIGEMSPADVLADFVDGPVTVDNDVNWAARAELDAAPAGAMDDAVYLHLGEGLGGAVVSDGEVRRGHRGFAGEVMHVLTIGPGGRAYPFTEVFARAGLRRDGSAAIDTAKIAEVMKGRTASHRATRTVVVKAVAGVCAAVTGLTDPEVMVLGGSWGADPDLVAAVAAEVARQPRPIPVVAATVTTDPSFSGARLDAVERLHDVVVGYRTWTPAQARSL